MNKKWIYWSGITLIFMLLTIGIVLLGNYLWQQSMQNSIVRYEERLLKLRTEPTIYGKKYNMKFVRTIREELKLLPYPKGFASSISFSDTFGASRSKNADFSKTATRIHEGCDLMYEPNRSGEVPILSMTDGIVEQKGWLTLGGYRIGVRSKGGIYYYYAHLSTYANLEIGDSVKAGQLLGFMGDTGYGEEGTTGQFPVHLHVGCYVNKIEGRRWNYPARRNSFTIFMLKDNTIFSPQEEISVNPYPFLVDLK